ncbi:MAG: thiamine pyrophosphate-dependent enzyme, partial [Pseudomonadota bacterium]|nr:thiamine pyrophosphate-dependent enzyme [Pseudomonadota bacterium]
GTYGLTKGQFSATNDLGSTSKKGQPTLYAPIDLVSMALQIGASFVARSFSGDKRQLVPLMKAAIMHKGFAFIDVISPCVMFNNHDGSTKSYDYVRQHTEHVVDADVVLPTEEITVDYKPGSKESVNMPDGSLLHLNKLSDDYDPYDRVKALGHVQEAQERGEVVTGLLYVSQDPHDCHEILETTDVPLNALEESALCPGASTLLEINQNFR